MGGSLSPSGWVRRGRVEIGATNICWEQVCHTRAHGNIIILFIGPVLAGEFQIANGVEKPSYTTNSKELTKRNLLIALILIVAAIGLGRYVLHNEGYPEQPERSRMDTIK